MKHRTSRNRQGRNCHLGPTEGNAVVHLLRHRFLSFAMVLALVAIGLHVLTSGIPAQEESTSTDAQAPAVNPDPPGTIDGAKNPELIPDEKAYKAFFLAVAEPEDAAEDRKAMAREKVRTVGLKDLDSEILLHTLSEFDRQMKELNRQSEQVTAQGLALPGTPLAQQLDGLYQRKEQLVGDTISLLNSRLSIDGAQRLYEHVQQIKKDIKLFPMPDMGPACCSSLLDGLFPKVYAQTMNPTGMIYTQVNIGTNGIAYATGVTDASSSCYCHQSTVTVTLRSPTGRQASNSRYNAVETARADTWLSHLEGEDGFTTATSTHKAYCPYCHCYFINNRQTSQGFTAIEHAYPQPPLNIPCKVKRFFDSITSAGTKHRAQDISGDGIAVGTPVYAAEGGWIDGIQTGQAHDPRSEQIVNGIPACSGQGSPANYVRIRDQQAPGGNKTTYVHVTVCCGLSVGMRVEAGQQIGTVDVSGCSTGPHVHMQRRKPAGNLVNFSVPCNYNNLVPSGFNYEDGPFSY